MHRRTFLAGLPTGALISLAGCAAWGGSWGGYSSREITLERVDIEAASTEITDHATVTDADLVPSPFVTELFSRLRDGERIELEEIDLELFDRRVHHSPVYHERDGEIYRIDRIVVNAGPVTGPEYHVSRIGNLPDDVSADDNAEVLSFAELPEVDQWRLHEAFSFSERAGGLIFFSDSTVIGYHDPDHETNSVLIDGIDQRFLDIDGDYVELERGEEASVRVEHVRLAAEYIADDTESFAEYALGHQAIERTELHPELQELLDELQANEGSLYADSEEDSEKYDELNRYIDQLRMAKKDQRILGPGLYIWYEGEYYRVNWHADHAP
ncbi:hypothetical protein [Halosolutus halophilus]|uniref:hypothetical protein n=1 Tax=Halosolutus halophilus TaxID=1552990 RepID=UPI002234F203|nr:hypothetical protein [Halosolutus halophilus]